MNYRIDPSIQIWAKLYRFVKTYSQIRVINVIPNN